MAVPLPVVIAGAVVAFLFLLLINHLSEYFTRNSQVNQKNVARLNNKDNMGSSSSASNGTMDAFDIKEKKKQMLLERARKRYMSLHPDFIPPEKFTKAL